MFRGGQLARKFSQGRFLKAIRPFKLADVGEGIKECEVIQWYVQPNARVDEFDPICEVQSDKATVEITSRYSGVIKALHYEVGQMAQVGSPLLDIDTDDAAGGASAATKVAEKAEPAEQVTPVEPFKPIESTQSEANVSKETAEPSHSHARAVATPAVRRLCKEHSIDIAQVSGTGKDSRVMKEDILNLIKGTAGRSSVPPPPTTVPLKGIAKHMFVSMSKAASTPHFLYTEEIEMDSLVDLRSRVNRNRPKKLSYMPFMIKALSIALGEYPVANSRLLVEEQAVEMRPRHNIAIAMDTPGGLVVPSIKSCETLSVAEIGDELARLQELGAAGQLTSADLKGGTITLSNIGSTGGMYVSPVIVQDQVCIGGLGKIRKLPRFDEQGNVVARSIMCCSWAGDHRILDGMTVALLVSKWKNLLENPSEMLLYLK